MNNKKFTLWNRLTATLVFVVSAVVYLLTIEPTAEICPWVDKKKLTTEESAVPNSESKHTSSKISKTSTKDRYQPTTATYPKHKTIAQRHTMRVDKKDAT